MYFRSTRRSSRLASLHSSVDRHRWIWQQTWRRTACVSLVHPQKLSIWQRIVISSVQWWRSLTSRCQKLAWQRMLRKHLLLLRRSVIRLWFVHLMSLEDVVWRLSASRNLWRNIWQPLLVWHRTVQSWSTVSCAMQLSVRQMRSQMASMHLYQLLWSISSLQVFTPVIQHVFFHPEEFRRSSWRRSKITQERSQRKWVSVVWWICSMQSRTTRYMYSKQIRVHPVPYHWYPRYVAYLWWRLQHRLWQVS